MTYVLGVDVGTSYTAAATCRLDDRQQNHTDVVSLGSRAAPVASVLFLGADGSVLIGEAAERRALTDPDRVVREFKRRIGDDTPLFVGGEPYTAHDLVATMVRWTVDQVSEREGEPPDRIAITHPAGWGPYKKDLVRHALRAQGLHDLTFLAEPQAAALRYAAQERVDAGSTIAVYDLGGGTFDAAVVRKTSAGSFTLLGSPDGLEVGGADFDEAVLSHVRTALNAQVKATPPAPSEPALTDSAPSEPALTDSAPSEPAPSEPAPSQISQWDALDVEDPNLLSGLARLRRECTEAKEALSSDTEVSIPVLLPGINAQVRLVRSEFEEMIRPALEDTVESLSRAIRSADLTNDDVAAVLLVGGSSRVPLISQLVSAQLGCPVVVDADPKTTIALGAARSLASQAATTQVVPTQAIIPQAAQVTLAPAPMVTGAEPAVHPQLTHRAPGPDTRGVGGPRRKFVPSLMFSTVMAGLITAGVLILSAWIPHSSFPFAEIFGDDAPSVAPGAVPTPSSGDRAKASTVGSLGATRGRADLPPAPAPVPSSATSTASPPTPLRENTQRGITPAPSQRSVTPPRTSTPQPSTEPPATTPQPAPEPEPTPSPTPEPEPTTSDPAPTTTPEPTSVPEPTPGSEPVPLPTSSPPSIGPGA